jgi:hypothetical protein
MIACYTKPLPTSVFFPPQEFSIMRGMLLIFAFTALTAFCWGVYAPVLAEGRVAMSELVDGKPMSSAWRPFICVGLAYFLIAVLLPGAALVTKGEKGAWTVGGAVWSLLAGAAGAIGALGVILALGAGGNPIYVAPLVFGGAPVVNTFVTMSMNKSYREVGPFFLAGLILVIAGAASVLVFRPETHAAAHRAADFLWVGIWVATTAFCWGVYGPTLHKGQMKMAGSRLRPLMCVGLAYFLIAVLIPLAKLSSGAAPGQWNVVGTAWSLGAGAAGALGAIGIIMAFNFGGRPIYVMPLVFGLAPVINTFISMVASSTSLSEASPLFFAGLIVLAVGAVVVLVFAPKPKHIVDPREAIGEIETQLTHVWMVRAFLKHADETAGDEELQQIHRALYDYQLATGAAANDDDAAAYLKLARKKFAKLQAAAENFAAIQPEVSSHTNFQMAARSLTAAVTEIERLLAAVE